MIKTEHYYIGNKEFIRTWSDEGRYVVGGFPEAEYTEANDPAELGRIYVEGRLISEDEAETEEPTPDAWDVEQGEYIPAGRIITVHGVMYECIKNHYAAWSKQPPNDEYWRTI